MRLTTQLELKQWSKSKTLKVPIYNIGV